VHYHFCGIVPIITIINNYFLPVLDVYHRLLVFKYENFK